MYAILASIFAPARNIIEYITTKPMPIISDTSDDISSSAPDLKSVIKYITTMKRGAISKLANDVIASELLRIIEVKSLFIRDTTTLLCLSVELLDSTD